MKAADCIWVIGVDFDNTIASYDELMHAIALERARAALERDGLLAPERKRPLPPFPRPSEACSRCWAWPRSLCWQAWQQDRSFCSVRSRRFFRLQEEASAEADEDACCRPGAAAEDLRMRG
jgi:hypothetical protein